MELKYQEPLAVELAEAVRSGDVDALAGLLAHHPNLASVRIIDGSGGTRSLLHLATDWPGYFPNGPAVVRLLIEAGADPNIAVSGMWHSERPLHWAASSDDVEVARALIDGGADVEAPAHQSRVGRRSMTRSATGAGTSPVCSWSAGHELTGYGTPRRWA